MVEPGANGFLPSYLIKPYVNYSYKSFYGIPVHDLLPAGDGTG